MPLHPENPFEHDPEPAGEPEDPLDDPEDDDDREFEDDDDPDNGTDQPEIPPAMIDELAEHLAQSTLVIRMLTQQNEELRLALVQSMQETDAAVDLARRAIAERDAIRPHREPRH